MERSTSTSLYIQSYLVFIYMAEYSHVSNEVYYIWRGNSWVLSQCYSKHNVNEFWADVQAWPFDPIIEVIYMKLTAKNGQVNFLRVKELI